MNFDTPNKMYKCLPFLFIQSLKKFERESPFSVRAQQVVFTCRSDARPLHTVLAFDISILLANYCPLSSPISH